MMSLRETFLSFGCFLILILCAGHLSAQPLHPVRMDGKWGMVDDSARIRIPLAYGDVVRFRGYIMVTRGNKSGLRQENGDMVLPPIYDELTERTDGLILLRIGDRLGFFHQDSGWTVQPAYAQLGMLQNGRAIVVKNEGQQQAFGLISEAGRLEMQPDKKMLEYRGASWYEVADASGTWLYDAASGRELRLDFDTYRFLATDRIMGKNEAKWSLLSRDGQVLTPPAYDSLRLVGQRNIYFERDTLRGIADYDGKELLAGRYDALDLVDGVTVRAQVDGLWGVVRLDGKPGIPFAYDFLQIQANGQAIVQRDGRYGVVTADGRTVLEPAYRSIRTVPETGYYTVSGPNGWAIRDDSGRPTEVTGLDHIGDFEGGVAPGKNGSLYGLVSTEGRYTRPVAFDKVDIHNGYTRTTKGEDVAMVFYDHRGRESKGKRFIIEKSAEGPRDIARQRTPNSRAWPRSNYVESSYRWRSSYSTGRWGLISGLDGSVAIPAIYDEHRIIRGTGLTQVMREYNGRKLYGLVNHVRGKQLLKPMLPELERNDFLQADVARAKLSNGRRILIRKSGRIVRSTKMRWAGPFRHGRMRINMSGKLGWENAGGIEQLERRRAASDRPNRNEFLYCRGGKWGFIDARGKWAQKPTYDFVTDFENGVAFFKEDGHWGVIDTMFKEVLPASMDYLSFLKIQGETFIMTWNVDGRYAILDTDGRTHSMPEFSGATHFSEGLCAVRFKGQWGYVDVDGEWVVGADYTEARPFSEGIAAVRKGRKWFLIDRNGYRVAEVPGVNPGLHRAGRTRVQGKGGWGYLDAHGNWAIPPKYRDAQDFQHGMAVVRGKRGFGIVNRDGKVLLPLRYRKIEAFHEGMAVFRNRKRYGCIDSTGKVISGPRYRKMAAFSGGYSAVRDGKRNYFIDREGRPAISGKFAAIGQFACGLAPAKVGAYWGYVDTTGKMVIPPHFRKAGTFSEGFAAVHNGRGWCYIDRQGKVITGEATFTFARPFDGGLAVVGDAANYWFLVNRKGQQVHCGGLMARKIRNLGDGRVLAKVGGEWRLYGPEMRTLDDSFLISTDLLEQSSLAMTKPSEFRDGIAAVRVGWKKGLIRLNGEEVLPTEYDRLRRSRDRVRVERDNHVGYLNADGSWFFCPFR